MRQNQDRVVTIRLRPKVLDSVDRAAEQAGVSRSQFLRGIVEQAIEDLGIKQRHAIKKGGFAGPKEIESFPGKSQRETLETIYAVMLAQAEDTRKRLESLGDQPEAKDPERGQGAD